MSVFLTFLIFENAIDSILLIWFKILDLLKPKKLLRHMI